MKVVSIADINRSILRKRVYAFTLDIFLITVINKLLIMIYMNTLGTIIYHYPMHVQKELILTLSTVHTLTLLCTFVSYFFISYAFSQGQTPGKSVFGLQVVGKNQKLSIWQSMARTAGYFICYALGLVLYVVPFLRKDRRGIPDFLSQTRVVPFRKIEAEVEQQIDLFDRAA